MRWLLPMAAFAALLVLPQAFPAGILVSPGPRLRIRGQEFQGRLLIPAALSHKTAAGLLPGDLPVMVLTEVLIAGLTEALIADLAGVLIAGSTVSTTASPIPFFFPADVFMATSLADFPAATSCSVTASY